MWWAAIIQMGIQLVQAYSAKKEEEYRQRQFAQLARQEAGTAIAVGLEESARVGATAANMAANDGGGVIGSATAVLEDLSRQGMYRARSAAYSGELDARFGARVSNNSALIGAGLQAGAPLLQQWSQSWNAKSGAPAAATFNGGVASGQAAAGFGGGGGGFGGGVSSGMSALGG